MGDEAALPQSLKRFQFLQITLIPPDDLEAVVGRQHVLAVWRLQIFSVKIMCGDVVSREILHF